MKWSILFIIIDHDYHNVTITLRPLSADEWEELNTNEREKENGIIYIFNKWLKLRTLHKLLL